MAFTSISHSFQGGINITASDARHLDQALQEYHLLKPQIRLDVPSVVSFVYIAQPQVKLNLSKIRDRIFY